MGGREAKLTLRIVFVFVLACSFFVPLPEVEARFSFPRSLGERTVATIVSSARSSALQWVETQSPTAQHS